MLKYHQKVQRDLYKNENNNNNNNNNNNKTCGYHSVC